MNSTLALERLADVTEVSPRRLHGWLTGGAAIMILDVRARAAFDAGHLPTALHAPLGDPHQLVDMIRTELLTIVVCDTGELSRRVAQLLRFCGLSQVGYLQGGMAGLSDETMRPRTASISPKELRLRLASESRPLVVDTRDAREHRASRIAGSVQCSGSAAIARVAAGRSVVLVSATGRRAGELHAELARSGVDAVVLEGGLSAWIASGEAVARRGVLGRTLVAVGALVATLGAFLFTR